MRIGVFYPRWLPPSIAVYTNNLEREFKAMGEEIVRFGGDQYPPADVDLYWDPRTGRVGPYRRIIGTRKPLVATYHGAVHLALPPDECMQLQQGKWLLNVWLTEFSRSSTRSQWLAYRGQYAGIISVSQYCKSEIIKYIGLEEEIIYPIYHGLDHDLFHPGGANEQAEPYLLHVSAYQPKKNVDRLIAAYNQLPAANKPRMVAVVANYPHSYPGSGIELITKQLSHEQLVPLYQGATAFVFPSLHETFGMPIVEAMACGCPVITSNDTACSEVAGDAALLVNPRSIDSIASAMAQLVNDQHLRQELAEKGLKRAQRFTWRKSAEEHLHLFRKVVREKASKVRTR